jgi:hypothetical protein
VSNGSLTTEEKIIAAYLNVIRKVQVQDIAAAFNVNMGRVSEAVQAIQLAAGAFASEVKVDYSRYQKVLGQAVDK